MSKAIPVTSHAAGRRPAHPSITRQQVSDLVDQFYGRIRQNDRLGPIFEMQIEKDWDTHLEKMKLFWSSVLLRTGDYKGQPVPAHVKLTGVETGDFQIWLGMFSQTVDEVFDPDARPVVVEAAQRIATSLWLAMFGGAMTKPPVWATK